MKKLLMLAILACGFLMTSCGDDNGPEITLTSPGDNTSYSNGDSFNITGTVTDDVEVRSMAINAEGAFMISFDLSSLTDKTSVSFDETVVVDSTLNRGTFTLEIQASDDEGNSETESVEITIE